MTSIEPAGRTRRSFRRLEEVLNEAVAAGRIPGAVAQVEVAGRLEFSAAIGFRDAAAGEALPVDAIFRIASLSKPITTVAALLLAEEGRLDLGGPVRQYLPEFRSVQVGVEEGGALRLEPPRRAMTVQDLLRHTSGLTYGHFGRSAVKALYQEAAPQDPAQTMAEMAAKLAALPLAHHPGSVWDYGMSTDLLGRVVEMVASEDLDRFVAHRVLAPLGMSDTGFHVPPAAAGRIALPLPDSGKPSAFRARMPVQLERPRWFSGGSGMVSSAPDYRRFARSLLPGSASALLSPALLRLMASDHLGPALPREPAVSALLSDLAPLPSVGQGFGLGVAVRTDPGLSPVPGSVGDFSWQGAGGPYFWVDPARQLVAVLFVLAEPHLVDRLRRLFRTLVYGALL